MKNTQERLRKALQRCGMKKSAKDWGKALHVVIWELMKAHTRISKLEKKVDKKMAMVTKSMKVAERDIKKGKPKAAVKALKGAEKKNVKLTKEDREKRDPIIKKIGKHLRGDIKQFKKEIKEDKELLRKKKA